MQEDPFGVVPLRGPKPVPARIKDEIMTGDPDDTYDIKCAWLTFCDNIILSLSRLRNACPTLSQTTEADELKFLIDLTYSAEKAIGELQSKLMDLWAIRRDSLTAWMNCERDVYKNLMDKSISITSPSQGSRIGRTKRSQKSGGSRSRSKSKSKTISRRKRTTKK